VEFVIKRLSAQLNKRITIFSETKTDDGLGGSGVGGEYVFCTVWAAIWPTRAKETRKNMREGVTVSHTIRIRYRPGILTTMKIRYGTRIFEIKGGINPDEANRCLDMVCDEQL
jgi:SPP1 family predicted phage head-tail adaptor